MIWLLTGIPALAVFILVPSNSSFMGTAGPILMILELGYLTRIANKLSKLRQSTGIGASLLERTKLLPWALGLLLYGLIVMGVLGRFTPLMGCCAVALGSVTKIWIALRPLKPAEPLKLA